MSLGICQLVSAAVIATQFSAAAGIAAITAGVLFLALIEEQAQPLPATVANPAALLGYLATVAAAATGLLLASSWLASLAGRPPPLLLAGVALVLPLAQAVVLHLYLDRTFAESWRTMLVTAVAGAAVAAAILGFGVAPTALRGWALGFAEGVLVIVVFTFWAFTRDLSHPDPGGRRVQTIQAVLYTIAALAVALLVAPTWTTPFWLPLAGWLVGVGYAVLIGGVLGVALIGLFYRAAIAIAGFPVPWRAAFLRFAVDRSLLTVSDGEHRFIHLLIRDHLAGCDPDRLAEAVLRRRAELGAPAPAGSR
jgi:hypothetical protein